MAHTNRLGDVVLFGSGETAPAGRRIHEHMMSRLKPPVRAAILETPAGFEPNSEAVAQRVAQFMSLHLQNFKPEVSVIPARSRQPPLSTDDPGILSPLLEANYIFAGAGSPTYMARQMAGSLTLRYLIGRHRRGATIALASAAAIAAGSQCLPVYEIFKAGHDLHWDRGVGFFEPFGLDLAIVTHWNNREGGEELDTRHCYMGAARMAALRRLLPPSTAVLGIDEGTALAFDFQEERCQVLGIGGVTIWSVEFEDAFTSGDAFPIRRLGPYRRPGEEDGTGPYVLRADEAVSLEPEVPEEVLALVQRREELRRARRYAEADFLRLQVSNLGYQIEDTGEGYRLKRSQPEG